MDDRLRTSAAHVIVDDVDVPTLDDPAFHHLARVLRLSRGAPVTVTDGRGRWRRTEWVENGVEPSGEAVVEARSPELTIAVAAPKGDRLDWLVAKVTEIGVDRIVLLDAVRSVVRLAGDRAERRLERLRRIAGEAAMQSRRVWLPEIVGPERSTDYIQGADVAVAEPAGRPLTIDDRTVAIGPEGGWSEGELALVADRQKVSLGSTILRVETAAIAAAVQLTSLRDRAVTT